ncbi:hypothetical protein Droror1_Dr00024770 [Drosera rotundifolia]
MNAKTAWELLQKTYQSVDERRKEEEKKKRIDREREEKEKELLFNSYRVAAEREDEIENDGETKKPFLLQTPAHINASFLLPPPPPHFPLRSRLRLSPSLPPPSPSLPPPLSRQESNEHKLGFPGFSISGVFLPHVAPLFDFFKGYFDDFLSLFIVKVESVKGVGFDAIELLGLLQSKLLKDLELGS